MPARLVRRSFNAGGVFSFGSAARRAAITRDFVQNEFGLFPINTTTIIAKNKNKPMESKIAVIGVGGRTGAMFAFEFKKAAEVLGVGREKEIEIIQKKKLYIKKEGHPAELFEVKAIKDTEFPDGFLPARNALHSNAGGPEIIFLTIKNPVGPAVEYYYQKIKNEKKLPVLVLSQNGLAAGEEAKNGLEKTLGQRANEVQIIRLSLLNAVERKNLESKIYIGYSLPIRLCFGVFSGQGETKKIAALFKEAGIEAEEIPPEKVRDMEFSKLFLNLIGMSSAANGLSLREGFGERETFKEEINSLREYIRVVRAAGGNFLNLSPYPIKLFVFLVEKIPLPILIFFRQKIWTIVSRGRKGKEKGNLDEIDYYQGEVVRLGKETGIKTSVSEEILKRAKNYIDREGCLSG
ncbi:hypothetical protein KJ636_05895 [Patescibacteria group bacterium]|nr:hypothetical protein [Patescibacteria group bacterium]MBU4480835.1 hypothetical protein [Patescibacteria group bacterium]